MTYTYAIFYHFNLNRFVKNYHRHYVGGLDAVVVTNNVARYFSDSSIVFVKTKFIHLIFYYIKYLFHSSV